MTTDRRDRAIGRRLAVAVAAAFAALAAVAPSPLEGQAAEVARSAGPPAGVAAPAAYRALLGPAGDGPDPRPSQPVPVPVPTAGPPSTAPVRPSLPKITTTARPGTAAAAALAFALAQRGLPYVWGGDGPQHGEEGFDCSGLTTAAYAYAGVRLPRTAHTQYYAGPHVPAGAELKPGDLVFYGVPSRVHHVGLYLRPGLMVNAPTFGRPVRLAQVRYPGDDYLGATRPAAGRDAPGLLTSPELPFEVPRAPAPRTRPEPTEFPAPPVEPASELSPEPAAPSSTPSAATDPSAPSASSTPPTTRGPAPGTVGGRSPTPGPSTTGAPTSSGKPPATGTPRGSAGRPTPSGEPPATGPPRGTAGPPTTGTGTPATGAPTGTRTGPATPPTAPPRPALERVTLPDGTQVEVSGSVAHLPKGTTTDDLIPGTTIVATQGDGTRIELTVRSRREVAVAAAQGLLRSGQYRLVLLAPRPGSDRVMLVVAG